MCLLLRYSLIQDSVRTHAEEIGRDQTVPRLCMSYEGAGLFPLVLRCCISGIRSVPLPIQNTARLAYHTALPWSLKVLAVCQVGFHHNLHCWCFIGKRPKKGMATAKQRLGKILKLNRNGHARFFVWQSCCIGHSSLWRPISGVREPGASAVPPAQAVCMYSREHCLENKRNLMLHFHCATPTQQ